MKAIVSGGSGFIGSHIIEELERLKWDVTIYDIVKPKYETKAKFIEGNIVELSLPKRARYDVVFHCAGMIGTETLFADPYNAEAVNVLGTIAVLDWAKSQPNDPIVIQTNLMGDWDNPYMISKNQGERYGKMYYKEWGVNYISVNPTDVYGPRQSTTQKKAAPTFITKAIAGEKIPLYGDGTSWVNYIFVKDVAKFVVKAAKKEYAGETINLSHPDNDMPVIDFAKEILRLVWKSDPMREGVFCADKNKAIQFFPMRSGQPGNIKKTEHDLSLAKAIMILDSLASLEDGLKETIEWYRQYYLPLDYFQEEIRRNNENGRN